MSKYTPSDDHPWRLYSDMSRRARERRAARQAANKELSKEKKLDISRRANAGEDPKGLALEYGISASYVSKLKTDWATYV